MVLICEQEANFVGARDRLVEALKEGRLSIRAVNASNRRMDELLKLAGEPEQFDEDEFQAASLAMAKLKEELKTAEETGEYSPLYGTEEGTVRRSSNF
jgi:hypothetical protein